VIRGKREGGGEIVETAKGAKGREEGEMHRAGVGARVR
jgi:hypothetical protein